MIGVILCGGAGSRLWPASREYHPKPFLRLPDGQSLMQKTLRRGASLPGMEEIVSVTNRNLLFKIYDELKHARLDIPVRHILEPFGRNTAPAIAAAAFAVRERHGDDAVILVLAADHLIADAMAFSRAVEQAEAFALADRMAVFGIRPTRAETGYGYLEADGDRVARFVEKPDAATAEALIRNGNVYWNSGMFCFKAGVILSELERRSPEVYRGVEKCLQNSIIGGNENTLDLNPDLFASVPDISIDYAVMEKSDRLAIVPCDIGWSDVGSWSAWCGLVPEDADGNRVVGDADDARLLDATNCDILTHGRLVAAIGVDDLLIVDTDDAVLVADKNKTEAVKTLYNRLKQEDHPSYRQHTTVYRPWGSYSLLETAERFTIKKLTLHPGGAISLQLHRHRSEHWIVVSGMAEIAYDDKVFFLGSNESTYIKAGHRHRIFNRGLIDLVIIEVQCGDYLGEDDVVRFEDDYGRC